MLQRPSRIAPHDAAAIAVAQRNPARRRRLPFRLSFKASSTVLNHRERGELVEKGFGAAKIQLYHPTRWFRASQVKPVAKIHLCQKPVQVPDCFAAFADCAVNDFPQRRCPRKCGRKRLVSFSANGHPDFNR